jgi:hypothetical protein
VAGVLGVLCSCGVTDWIDRAGWIVYRPASTGVFEWVSGRVFDSVLQ